MTLAFCVGCITGIGVVDLILGYGLGVVEATVVEGTVVVVAIVVVVVVPTVGSVGFVGLVGFVGFVGLGGLVGGLYRLGLVGSVN